MVARHVKRRQRILLNRWQHILLNRWQHILLNIWQHNLLNRENLISQKLLTSLLPGLHTGGKYSVIFDSGFDNWWCIHRTFHGDAPTLLNGMLPPPQKCEEPPGHQYLTTQLQWQFHPQSLLAIRGYPYRPLTATI